MIGIVDVEVQAANPQMPLCPFVAFVGSPSSVRVRNVPGNIGSWNITKVYVSANYPDNSIQSRECTRVGEIYVGTLPACDTAGKGANGFAISADGVDESGNAVTGYVLGKGDLEILDADGAITPGVTTHYVHGLDEQPSDPHEYDIYKDGDTWKIYFNGAWGPLAPAPVTLDDTVTSSSANPVKSGGIWSAIWGALSALPTGFTSLYDWCVSQLAGKASKSDVDPLLFAQYYPDGSVKSAAEFTAGIKYDAPDTTNRTITVKPFCNTGDSDNDNSSLVGRVVIPPFVDAQGNGYISDDGTRYKVVGVISGSVDNNQSALTAIVAPNTVTDLGYNAFNGCQSLASISIPAVTSISDTAFGSCTSLVSISIPAATDIVDYAFSGCTALTSVDFGDTSRSSVPTLGENAFDSVPTSCKIIVPYTQYDAWKAATGWSSLPQEFVRHAEKADKPATFTTGNLAEFDADGNPTDSGVKPSDKLDSTSAAPAFSSDSSVSYAIGSHVTYNGKLYVCTTATTGGTWDASAWTADTMTDPDATLDITAQNQLRVVAKDGTLLWAQGYDLASTSSATLACDATNNFTFADGATSQAFTLPTAPTGKVGDFGLDIDNYANTRAATISFTNITNNTASVVIPKGESLNDMLSIAAGELARFYITLSTFRVNKLPTWHIVKQVVENGGAQS